MLTLLRTRAAFWAGAGILAMAGAATSLAAAGLNQPEEDAPAETPPSLVEAEQSAAADTQLLDGSPPEEGIAGDSEAAVTEESAVRGVPEDSPACENVGCGEVENAGGVTLHLPQPAVDGITRAAENREAARNKGEDEEDGGEEPAADEAVAEGDEESTEDTVRGVPEDSPACENVGCGEVTNPGGVTLHLPQPAVDGMNKAAENRAAAHDKENGGATASGNGKGKGKP
ncbi:MAG: hypothetical protein IH609_20795 [Dehalococcoidia bacterium]|nr:hypothetical protein [Dehalococcoidia bacterium]